MDPLNTSSATTMIPRMQETLEFLQTPLQKTLLQDITGNVPDAIKEVPLKWLSIFEGTGKGFGANVKSRWKVTDVSVIPHPDDPFQKEGRVTLEVDVTPDMCSYRGVLDEGCIVFIIDECSSIAMTVLNAYEKTGVPPGVSQTISTMFHSNGLVGTRLRIVNKSLTIGSQSNSGRTEIWDATHHTLIASGVQLTMPPSKPTNWDRGSKAVTSDP